MQISIRVFKPASEEKKLFVDFVGMSPYQAFGIALACASSMGVRPAQTGSLQNLLRKSSGLRGSLGDVIP